MKLLFALVLFIHAKVFAQSVREIIPSKIIPLDFNNEAAIRFAHDRVRADTILARLNEGKISHKELSNEEKKLLAQLDEGMFSYYDILGAGCSWYCGGGPKENIIASSELKPQGTITYAARNAHDLNYERAWVEGVSGYGVGEYLLYTFAAASPRITEIIVVNGYVKTEKAYFDNSRVKKLKVSLNDKPFAILNLEDRRAQQVFTFEPIGNGNRQDKTLHLQPDWTLKFEILEVYKGLKYDDVVISEIYFGGIDVH